MAAITAKELIKDYKAEIKYFSACNPHSPVTAEVSFDGEPSTAQAQIDYCHKAIAALEAGEDPEKWNY